MKYSSINLHEPGIALPLEFPVKVLVEYRSEGVLIDYAPLLYTNDPEAAADEIVRARSWDRRPGYKASDVWVDAGM
jgi:hypothetical protein